ncbi:MAG: hypothetical protein UX59_C0004G0007 [Microgenomates group bacterium GW2011_GWA1_46_7]|nr:MAG: hypothetical protein UX59_C0004G0007 [Microgenomates group bacterium GW2011_GWA1_46_7]
MKQFITGLFIIIVLGLVGYAGFRGAANLVSRYLAPVTPTPTPAGFVTSSPTPSASASVAPTPSTLPTTKGGLVKGQTTVKTTTTTTTTSHLLLTLIKTNECKSYTTEVKDITGPLTLRYSLKDGYKAAITAWKSNGEEILSQREISGSGELIKVTGLTYLKLQAQPTKCDSTSDIWLTITAER